MTNLNIDTPVADILTPRLDLIAITPELVQSERDQSMQIFESLVCAMVPEQWRPQDWEPHVLDFLLKQIADFPWSIGWARFVALRDPQSVKRILIGTVGAVPPGTEMSQSKVGEIEVGYGILPAFQRRGFATEALAGLMPWVQTQTHVSAFVAQTFPHLQPSIRVLEKSGFQLAGKGFEEGTILLRRCCETISATETG
jgi:ribosomal-protein-alanine N-acetyltransferase